jgi:pilus assembly protein CpaB
MRNTSIMVLVAAIVLGLFAVLGVRTMLGAQSTAAGGQVQMTTVVVARKPLEFGTELSADALQVKDWPANAVPEGAFTTIDEVVGGDRRVALRSIAVGDLVLKDRVSGFGGRAALSQVIEEGYRAVAVRISDVSGAGGFILPGDRVDVVLTVSPTNDKLDMVADILLENVRVLAIDQVADESTGGAIVAKAATLEVTGEDAQKIALASAVGTLSLSLRNTMQASEDATANDKEEPKTIRFKDLGPAQPATNPAAPRPVRRAAPVDPNATMNVVRGVEQSRTSVPRESGRAGGPTALTNATAGSTAAVAGQLKISAPSGE